MDPNIANALIVGVFTLLAAILTIAGTVALTLKVTRSQHKKDQENLEQQYKQQLEIVKLQNEQQQQLLYQQQHLLMPDRDIFLTWRIAFDRGAFRGPWRWKRSLVDIFQTAISAVILAVNTGTIREAPDQKGRGKANLNSREWFSKMNEVTGHLDRIVVLTREYQEYEKKTEPEPFPLWPSEKQSSQEYDKALQEHQQAQNEREKSLKGISEAVDRERDKIIDILNPIWEELNIPTMPRPTEVQVNDLSPFDV